MSDSHFKIRLDDKPNLQRALLNDPARAKEVIATFVSLIEESFDEGKGVQWSKLPEELSPELTFRELVTGILRGALDVREMNPDTFDVLKVEVHPLSMLTPRKNHIDGGMKYYQWREHFKIQGNEKISGIVVEKIIRKMLRYSKYIDVQTLQGYLQANQIATYRGLGAEQVNKLPLYPALRYQQEKFGDLHVGKFYDEVGFFDCGTNEESHCLACNRYELQRVGNYKCCLACNAGYISIEGGENNVADTPPA
ncbi:hypothetical protein UFOVP451_32 [uncultured Caudovirales phage]|uniref:Uncharacterized protein n=1 Tax=uncultured Caudovirales phage TaxID=2100421 RepID=A0A6J5MBB2_9CAUD|nr:hypothetical protein UFOVP451_32 [uncultured Caudovirales phage]